jgi:hypothetical protein
MAGLMLPEKVVYYTHCLSLNASTSGLTLTSLPLTFTISGILYVIVSLSAAITIVAYLLLGTIASRVYFTVYSSGLGIFSTNAF